MKIINVKFRKSKKIYPFLVDNNLELSKGDYVIVETIRGNQIGIVLNENKNYSFEDENPEEKIRKIVKKLNDDEIKEILETDKMSDEAYFRCKKIVKKILPSMNLVIGEYTYKNEKLIFYFTSEERLDFRELVKAVNKEFNRKVEFYQIKFNDENRILNSFGKYGKELFW